MNRSHADLEQRLRALGTDLSWPEESDLVPAVLATIGETAGAGAQPQPRGGSRAWSGVAARLPTSAAGRLAVATALSALLLLVLIPTGVPAAVARFLGVPGVAIRTVEVLPPAGEEPGWLGEAITLRSARERADFPVRTLPLRADLDRVGGGVHLDERRGLPIVTIVYAEQPGLPEVAPKDVGAIFTQLRADVRAELFRKVLGPDSRLDAVKVSGQPAWWISGAEHVLVKTPGRDLVPLSGHRAGNTLLWESEGITYRLETALPKADALALAESLR